MIEQTDISETYLFQKAANLTSHFRRFPQHQEMTGAPDLFQSGFGLSFAKTLTGLYF